MSEDDARLRVLLVTPVENGGQAWRWLRRAGEFHARLAGWEDSREAGDGCDVVWVDAPSLDLPGGLPHALTARQRTGMLLTRGACRLIAPLGLGQEPAEQTDTAWHDADDDLHLFRSFTEFPHIRGHCAMRRHPLFDGLGNASYTWWPAEDEAFVRLTWRWPEWPTDAEVIAVERSYIHVNPDRATIWSHARPDAPRVLCIGAYLPFEARDLTFRGRLERLARNALHIAANRSEAGKGLVWRRSPPLALEDTTLPTPVMHTGRPRRRSHLASARPSDLAASSAAPAASSDGGQLPAFGGPSLAGTPGDDSPFTLAGRRVLVAGGEGRGIDEIWIHPLRVLSALRVEGAETASVEVTPAGITRTLRVAGIQVTEKVCAAYDDAAAVVEWSAQAPVTLALSFRSDLRLMWPYPGWCLSPLRWRRDGAEMVVHGSGGKDAVTLSWNRVPDQWEVSDASTVSNPVVSSRVVVALETPRSVARMSVTAVVDGEDPTNGAPAGAGAASLVEARVAAVSELLADRLAVDCSDDAVSGSMAWAAYRLDSAVVRTPGVGTSLVAGYWTSSEGWGDGRPGYAWYFGRDAAWTALGSLALGDFAAAAHTLRFLGRHQDLSGKILHECTTSGLVHYDAADSTTLYLLLAARYLAWTGDQALIREEWPRIRRAFDFAIGTDHDGDGLVENTRIGHGWIEFGRLGGGDVTHYNAAIWTAALRELADAARVAGQPEFATRLVALAIRARHALERVFYDEAAGRYALNVRRDEDGRWAGNWTQTAMQAVPLLLGMADAGRMAAWLDDVAGDAFTAPWGVRMVPRTDPRYDPKSYHGGAVWPLYTGWVSWAEFAAGRTRAAIRHWRMNAAIAFEREKGAWDEVLHGTEHRSAGVCPDQAWSTAMTVAPFVYGLLGVTPDALRKRLLLAPQIPEGWQHLRVERLRIGGARIALDYAREGDAHRFHLSASGDACTVAFEPAVAGTVAGVRVNGEALSVPVQRFGERQRARLEFRLDRPVTVEILT